MRENVVGHLFLFGLHNDLMAQGEQDDEFSKSCLLLDLRVVRRRGVCQLVVKVAVEEVHVADLGQSGFVQRAVAPEGNAVDAAFFVLHDVAGESAGFVGEDVLDLAEFLIQVGGLDCRVLVLEADHLRVLADEYALRQLHHFQSDQQADWHEVAFKLKVT